MLETEKLTSSINQLKVSVKSLKDAKARFEALVIIKEEEGFTIKYFFYTGVKSKLLILETKAKLSELIPSLTAEYPAIYNYEKEYTLQYGISFEGQVLPITPSNPCPEFDPDDQNTMVIPVGPIHAGVIEPGHFHFTCHGEHINNLEISLGYLTRNIEEEFENRNIEEGLDLAQNICGDSTLAYGLAYIQAIEKICGINVNKNDHYLRMIMLELERLYNHFGDIGGIINDTGFSLVNSYLLVLKEKILRINKQFFGHRFLRNVIKLEGLSKSLSESELNELVVKLKAIQKDFANTIELTFKHKTILDRLSNTGHLSHAIAEKLSITGIVGRASGISFDTRRDLAFAAYEDINFHIHQRREGDVYARLNIRIDETNESFKIISQCKNKILETTENKKTIYEDQTDLNLYAWSMVEAARGPVFCYVELNSDQKIKKMKMRDVSKHNWKALEYAVLGNIVPDFPLCNKSFSLAYAGNDM